MSEADAATSVNVAERLGFKDGDLIQEFGYDDDVDFDLRDDIEDLIGSELLDEDDHDHLRIAARRVRLRFVTSGDAARVQTEGRKGHGNLGAIVRRHWQVRLRRDENY